MSFKTINFDYSFISPKEDGNINGGIIGAASSDAVAACVLPGIKSECGIRLDGLSNLILDPGNIFIMGRHVVVFESMVFTIPPFISGTPNKHHLVCSIDLSKVNTYTGVPGTETYKMVNNQVTINLKPEGTIFKQENIMNNGIYYDFIISTVELVNATTPPTFTQPLVAVPGKIPIELLQDMGNSTDKAVSQWAINNKLKSIKQNNTNSPKLIFSTDATQPAPVAGHIIVWFKPV